MNRSRHKNFYLLLYIRFKYSNFFKEKWNCIIILCARLALQVFISFHFRFNKKTVLSCDYYSLMNKQTVFYRMNIYIPRNVQTFQSKPTRLSSFEKKMQTNESKTCGRTCLNEYVYWAKKCYYKHFQNVWVEKRVQNCAFIMIFWNVCVFVYFWCEGAIMEVV